MSKYDVALLAGLFTSIGLMVLPLISLIIQQWWAFINDSKVTENKFLELFFDTFKLKGYNRDPMFYCVVCLISIIALPFSFLLFVWQPLIPVCLLIFSILTYSVRS